MTMQQVRSGARTSLPRQISLMGGTLVVLRAMERWDRHEVTTLFRALAPDTGLAMPMDLADDAAADEWIAALESGHGYAVVARAERRLVAYAGLRRGATPWTQHLGEFSLLVLSGWPAVEVGRHLCRELMKVALDLNLRKIVTQIRADDPDARAIFADVGFLPEALLANQVIDRDARTYDLLIMSRPLAACSRPSPTPTPHADDEAGNAVPDPRDQPDILPREPTRVPAAVANLVAAAAAIAIPEPVVLAEPSAPAPPARPLRSRRGYAVAAALGALALLAMSAVYLTTSPHPRQLLVLGATAAPSLPAAAPPGAAAFTSTHEGSGAVFLSAARPAMAVRVRVRTGVVGTWFWCIESSFGIPLADHYCATAAVSAAGSDELVAQTVLQVDPTWPSDALYFIQMYCEGACVWHVDAAPLP